MVALLLVSLMLTQASAQAPPPPPVIEVPVAGVTQELKLNDGSSVIGRVEAIEGDRFTFRTTSGVLMTVDIAQARSLKPVTGRMVGGELWRNDSNPTRLFFAPTGRALKKGEAYFGVYEVLMPFVQVGVTDRFSIGGGTPLMWVGADEQPIWITPKLQVARTRSTAASIGVMHLFNVDDGNLGIAYGVVTQGTTDNAATFGVGYAYERTGDADGGAPLVMIGGEHRLSRRTKFVTENYIFKSGGFASGGIRFLGEKLSADVGFVIPLVDEGFFVLPMINIVRKF